MALVVRKTSKFESPKFIEINNLKTSLLGYHVVLITCATSAENETNLTNDCDTIIYLTSTPTFKEKLKFTPCN